MVKHSFQNLTENDLDLMIYPILNLQGLNESDYFRIKSNKGLKCQVSLKAVTYINIDKTRPGMNKKSYEP